MIGAMPQSDETTGGPAIVANRLKRMTGRDPQAHERPATPPELLYDLVFVVAFGVAGSELVHSLAAAHPWEGAGPRHTGSL